MNLILALVNQKGGCGKTTSAIHLAAAFARRDLRVLLIDLDPQGHATLGLGVEAPPGRAALSDILAASPLTGAVAGLEEAVVGARPGLDLVPANLGLAGLEMRLSAAPGREERLAEHLAGLSGAWDLVLIDSPPNLGLLTVNALVAAERALIPLEPSPFAAQGAVRILETIRMVREHTGHQTVPRVLPTMVPGRDPYALEALDAFAAAHPGLVLPLRVRRSILFPRAAAAGKTVGEIAPHAPAWKDFLEVAGLLEQEWGIERGTAPPRLFRLRVVPGGVEFTHPDMGPSDVLLAGEFNGWIPDQGVELEDRMDGGWTKRMRLAPGRYEYKFVVRSEWLPDPVNPRRAESGLGAVNSIVEIPPAPGVRLHDEPARPAPQPVP